MNAQHSIVSTDKIRPKLTLQQLTERVDILEYVTARYSGTFDQVYKTCTRLAQYMKVCVLLDFDVLRTFITAGAEHPTEFLAIEYFFERGTLPFAVPAGAFCELIDHLGLHKLTKNRLLDMFQACRPSQILDTREALVFLSESMGVKNPHLLSSEDLELQMTTLLEKEADQLSRLLYVLKHKRCTGIRIGYLKRHYQGWLKILSAQPRRRAIDKRTKVDQRDAINLAIATQDFLNLASGTIRPSFEEGYILVSQTQTLLTLADYANYDHFIRNVAANQFHADIYKARDQYPVLYPIDLVTFELLGGATSRETLNQTKIRSRKCKEVFEVLQREIVAQKDEAEEPLDANLKMARLRDKAFEPYRNRRQQELYKLLEDLDAGLKRAEAQSTFNEVETFRASIDAIEMMITASQGLAEDSDTQLKHEALHFGRIFNEVATTVTKEKTLKYRVTYLSQKKEPFKRLYIRQSHELADAIISGEFYPANALQKNHYYALRWPITCTEIDFISALESTLTPPSDYLEYEDRSCHLELVTDKQNTSRLNRLLLETSMGNFVACLGGKNFHWDGLLLKNIAAPLRSLGTFAGPTTPLFHRMRIFSLLGEIIFDFVPHEGNYRRYITVISSFNIADHLAILCERTAIKYIVKSLISDALNIALSEVFLPFLRVRP